MGGGTQSTRLDPDFLEETRMNERMNEWMTRKTDVIRGYFRFRTWVNE